ncbi:2-amino-3-ketobutyrate coenzyme A ligase [Citrobacter amalonaticus]|nr:2-amino-3-ketobutyrate coenzyme A ligase [Citrobacter amalonaticus]
MRGDFYKQLTNDLQTARAEGLFKEERIITSAQQADITVADGSHVINFCANNYLGLANHPELIAAAKAGMDSHGFGMASVRFICGTQDSHKQLEQKLAEFLGMEDAILYSSCFDANGGLFETLLGAEDAIISDALNHASIIDGVRLCKAKRFRYANNDMQELEARLQEARDAGARHVLIATDGVFSMDGVIANLKGVCDLADKYNALVMVDDSHAVGFVGENGRGSHEYCDVMGRVDIITGTLGKALGGASGGYTAARKRWLNGCVSALARICSLTRWRRRLSLPPSKCWRWLSLVVNCAIACGLTRVSSVSKCLPPGLLWRVPITRLSR